MSLKLYVLTRKDMSPEQRAVQAGHAIADFCISKNELIDWTNGTLVYLEVDNAIELECWKMRLDKVMSLNNLFFDPDLHEGPTALFAYGKFCGGLLKDLPLMRFNIE